MRTNTGIFRNKYNKRQNNKSCIYDNGVINLDEVIYKYSYKNKSTIKYGIRKIRKQAYEELAGDINSEKLMDFCWEEIAPQEMNC